MTAAECRRFDDVDALARHVAQCAERGQALVIRGGGSKAFYGNPCAGEVVSPDGIRGIRDYTPDELYLTARAATPLAEISAALAANGQLLPFDAPQFGGGGTFGGAIAAGLAGPGKPCRGGVRDCVLGVQLINGGGEVLRFGGQVMKNVAGYDVSRLMAGALGTLGIITEATVKVLPRPAVCRTLTMTLPPAEAVATLSDMLLRSLPLAASFYHSGRLYFQFAGGSVDWAVDMLGDAHSFENDGSAAGEGGQGGAGGEGGLWQQVRDHALPFFQQRGKPLWRIAVPPTRRAAEAYSDALARGDMVFEWHGGLYWQAGGGADEVRRQAHELGGYACLFRRAEEGADADADNGGADTFLPPPSTQHLRLHQRLKHAFDPANILNVGRVYPDSGAAQ